MASSPANSRLNDLLVELHRSLAQYTTEAGYWTNSRDGEVRGVVEELVARQSRDAAQIVELLRDRSHPIDFGVYPHAYTSLNFVALRFLMSELVEHQQELVDLFETAARQIDDDDEARELVRRVAASQREGLVRLLSVKPPATASISA